MAATPDPSEYRHALYCRSSRLGLPGSDKPVALFHDERIAVAHGQLLWPSAYEVIDLHGEDSPCGKPS